MSGLSSRKLTGADLVGRAVEALATGSAHLPVDVTSKSLGSQVGFLDGRESSVELPMWKPNKIEPVVRDQVERAAAAVVDPNSFKARYMAYGLMLANPDGPHAGNYAEQMKAVKSASTDELQAVLRVTADRRGMFDTKEADMRAREVVRLRPEYFEGKVAERPDLPREQVFSNLRDFIARSDFRKQRELSTDPTTGKFPSLSMEDRVASQALTRGYTALAEELRLRGVEPDRMLKGASAGSSGKVQGRVDRIYRGGGAKPVMRDGIEV